MTKQTHIDNKQEDASSLQVLKKLLKFDVLDEQKSAKKSNKARNPNAQKVNACLPNPFGQVFVVNAEKVRLTGKRADQKEYLTYSGYPGGQKSKSFTELLEKHPDRIIRLAVKRMLPKTKLGSRLIHKLKVYKGEEHPHAAQNPAVLEMQ